MSATAPLTPDEIVGVVSLIVWALLVTVTGKYVLFLMQADNKGEGGILSLMALAQSALGKRTMAIFVLGVAGSALFSGDAVITPAISVLSAVEGLEAALARTRAVRAAGDRRHPDSAVPGPEPRDGGRLRAVRADHGRVLPEHRRARRDPYRRVLGNSSRAQPGPRRRLSACSRRHRIRRARQRLPGGHRRRSALRRHGPFRPRADPGRLDLPRPAGADSQLPRPGRPCHRRRRGDRKPLLSPGPDLGADSADHSFDHGDGDRQPGGDHRRLLIGAAGDSARPAAAPRNRPHVRDAGRPIVHPARQRRFAVRRSRAGSDVPLVERAGQRLWRRGLRHDGGDDGARLLRRVASVALVVVERAGAGLRLPVDRRRVPVRQSL